MSAQGEGGAACGEECDEALERLEAYLDGELPHTDVDQLRRHLTSCYPCTERASFEEQVRAIVREGCDDQAPPQLRTRIEEALDQSISGRGLS